MRPIDADALLNEIAEITDDRKMNGVTIAAVVAKCPTIEVYTEQDIREAFNDGYSKGKEQSVKHGRWNTADRNGISIKGYVVCSCCDVMIKEPSVERYGIPILKYCPVCGAKMDGKENKE